MCIHYTSGFCELLTGMLLLIQSMLLKIILEGLLMADKDNTESTYTVNDMLCA